MDEISQAFKVGDTVCPSSDVAAGKWISGKGYLVEEIPYPPLESMEMVRDENGALHLANGDVPHFRRFVITGSCGDPFEDQRRFMHSMGQQTKEFTASQVGLYLRLTAEELCETLCAAAPDSTIRLKELFAEIETMCRVDPDYNEVELLDGLEDVLVTTIGAGISAGFPMQQGWDEVLKTNLAKVDPVTGAVRRRADGKVLKPEGWVGPTQRLRELLARR